MNSNAMRGAVLVGVAVLIAALVLGRGADNGGSVVVADNPPAATVTPVATLVPQVLPTLTPVPAPIGEPRLASEVRVQVANAAEIAGRAGAMTARLNAQGYSTGAATNADPTTQSTVYFELGYKADAHAVLAVFGSPETTNVFPMTNPRPTVDDPDTVDGGANIIMIVGADELSRG